MKDANNHCTPFLHNQHDNKHKYFRTWRYILKWRIIVAVRANRIRILLSETNQYQFKLIQWTLDFFVEFDVSALWQWINFVTLRAKQAGRPKLVNSNSSPIRRDPLEVQKFHVSRTLAALGPELANSFFDRREISLKEFLHFVYLLLVSWLCARAYSTHIGNEILEFLLEHFKRVADNLFHSCFTLCNTIHICFYAWTDSNGLVRYVVLFLLRTQVVLSLDQFGLQAGKKMELKISSTYGNHELELFLLA